jgi:hypothetical protein
MAQLNAHAQQLYKDLGTSRAKRPGKAWASKALTA